MNGYCLINNVIYKYPVGPTATKKQRAYLGLAEGEWKQLYYNNLLEKEDIRTIQHFLVIYEN